MFFNNNENEFNFWPSIADTLLAIFMVFLMLWLIEKIIVLQELAHVKMGNEALTQQFAESKQNNKVLSEKIAEAEEAINETRQNAESIMLGWQRCEGEKQACEREKEKLIEENAALRAELRNSERLKDKVQSDDLETIKGLGELLQQCESDKKRFLGDKPPIINLPETLGFSFNTGRAQLSADFENLLKNNIVSRLKEIKDKYQVNVIEVIGHTDGVMARGNSNLDEKLADAVANGDLSGLSYGSNADLGLMRALAVVFFLQKQPQLNGIKFRAYSAAQLIPPNEVAGDPTYTDFDTRRRRIELRFTYLED
jgi:flagellar motor protein MotB